MASTALIKELIAAGAKPVSYTWTDITDGSQQIITPHYPGARKHGFIGTSDITSGVDNCADLKSGGNVIDIGHYGVHPHMSVSANNSGTVVTKAVATVDSATQISADSTWGFTAADTDTWVYPSANDAWQFIVVAYLLATATAVTYTFQDSAGTTVGTPVYLPANGGITTTLPFPVTKSLRLQLMQSAAAVGGITLWYIEERAIF